MILKIGSIVLSLIAITVAIISLYDRNRVNRWTTSYNRLRDAEKLLIDNPDMLAFHGIDTNELQASGVTANEIVYLLHNFRTMQEMYRFGPGTVLSPYYKNLLKNKKVRDIWNNYLRDKFVFRTKFAQDVDDYISELTDA